MKRLVFTTLLTVITLAGCANMGRLDQPKPTKSPEKPDTWAKWDETGKYRIRSSAALYAMNRYYDFMDMFEVGLSFGPWAKIEADYLIGFYGFGATDCTRIRLGGRSMVLDEETTTVSTLPFPASMILFPSYYTTDDEVIPTIVTFGGISYENEFGIWPDPVIAGLPQSRDRIRLACVERDQEAHAWKLTGDSMVVGAEAHLLIGARARVMPLQVFDFITGLVGWDMLGDDVKPFYPRDPQK